MTADLKRYERDLEEWAYFSQPGRLTPVKRLALNLGAPGDRKDASSGLWLVYPRPGGSLVLQLPIGVSLFPGGSYFNHDAARLQIPDAEKPWLFCSGVRGLRQCTIPVSESGDGTARYTVRLAFAELDHTAAGKRVFGIKIQGKVVAEHFDAFQAAGGRNKPDPWHLLERWRRQRSGALRALVSKILRSTGGRNGSVR